MSRRRIAMNPVAADAARLFGAQIRLARQAKRWTAAELAQRAGVSPRTVLGAEAGSESISFGNVLNVAVLAGVELFGVTDPVELARARRRGEERVALIPSKVYPSAVRGDDDGDYDF
jgi:transcriptional regulator with XRE-family HTH domain